MIPPSHRTDGRSAVRQLNKAIKYIAIAHRSLPTSTASDEIVESCWREAGVGVCIGNIFKITLDKIDNLIADN